MSDYGKGCLPAKKDLRDYKLCSSVAGNIEYPREFLLDNLPKVKNQGNVNSCCAHATSSILEWFDKNNHTLSTNFIYGIQKKLFNQKQPGMYLVQALSEVQKYGDMTEIDCIGNTEVPDCWSSAERAFDNKTKLDSAYRFRINSYYLCQTDNDIKYALMNYGPVLGAIDWKDTFSLDDNNVIYFDKKANGGGHCVVIIGWNSKGWIIQNSWGTEFGDNGRFTLPYYYGFTEARAVIDEENDNELVLVKPHRSYILDIYYKLVNFIKNKVCIR